MKSIRQVKWLPLGAASLMLVACGGGGGGGVNTTPPAPTPTPSPTPTPTPAPDPDVADLVESQTFTGTSSRNTVSLQTPAGIVDSTSVNLGEISISYNATTGTYTMNRDGIAKSFSPTDRVATGSDADRRYIVSTPGASEVLTLVDTSYTSDLRTRYVGLGFWQSSTRIDSLQNTVFDVFVYGFPTASSAVPRTGSAQYTTDVFGLTTQVGSDPLTFVGTGPTVFDFARSTFTIDTTLQEYYFVTGAGRSGALYFRASGALNSGDSSFSGTFLYDGSLDSVPGILNGAFYGPDAQEAGGVFSGSNGTGGTVVGGFTAANPGLVGRNIALTDLRHNEVFSTGQSQYTALQYKDGSETGNTQVGFQNGQLLYATDSSYRIAGYVEAEGKFSASDRVDGSGDVFAVYQKNFGDEEIQLSLYKPNGPGEVELTYASFGEYYRIAETSTVNAITRTFFMHGIDTPQGVLTARTGTATYNGIAYGAASNAGGQSHLAVEGTSQFQIDFATQGYAGWLKLHGTDRVNGSTVDFGQFDLVAGNGFPGNAFSTGLTQGASSSGGIQLRFYGPNADEMAGVFNVATSTGHFIGGATAAVR